MTPQAFFVLIILVGMIAVLAFDKMRPGMTLFSVVVLFLATGIINPSEAIAGFSNKGMITVAILFLVSEGVRQSGCLDVVIRKLLPSTKTTVPRALARMLPSIAAISAFLNNTAVVVIFAPIIKKWAETVNLPSKKFLIPLSYATILGGVCTLIGTSTNLVVDGLMQDQGFTGFSMFELGKIGVVIAVVGIAYIIVFGNLLLPGDRIMSKHHKEDYKEYYYDTFIPVGSRLAGSVVKDGIISQLPHMEVRSIKRNGKYLPTDGCDLAVEENDQILLAGKSGVVQSLIHTEGLNLCCLRDADQSFVHRAVKQVEAVLGPRFPGINRSLGDFNFYRHYGAVVMAVHRNGEVITVETERLILQEGDNLVLLTDGTFIETWGESKVFYLISEVGDFYSPKAPWRRWFALGLLAFMITGATIGEYLPNVHKLPLDMFFFATITMTIMAWTNLFPAKKYTKYVSWDILIAIASAFAISKAMQNSGIAATIAGYIISVAKDLGPQGLLAALFLITNLFTEIITNNAAAALSFPIAVAVAAQLGVSPMPFFVVICIAASASFSTPIGYQTNLIVQSVGGYRFGDYAKIGLPLNIITFLLSIFLIPMIWEF